jgi:hypothetical protein
VVGAGLIFVGGALGGEIAAGAYRTTYGIDGLYATLALVEESLEMGAPSSSFTPSLTIWAATTARCASRWWPASTRFIRPAIPESRDSSGQG